MATPATTSAFSSAGLRPRAQARRGGFALLITITLLAFLVLLLVSLATLTRVETQVAANGMQLAQARSNALFALNLALGQLQKYAGPDQAVTARADINTAVNTGNPFWTGVWDATPRDSAGAVLATPTHNPVTAPPPVAPMVWLVSGNEANGTAVTPAAAAVADPAAGNDNVWLVRKVLGQDLAAQLPDYPQDGRVKLAKTLIQVPAGQIPGFAAASSTPTPVGAYAWWVGDEGIKAKINLTDPYRAATADPETAWRRSAASRPGLEMLTASELKTAFTATTDAFETKRASLLAYQQLPMLSADLATATGVTQSGRYFNDLTTTGYGVLADTLRGGLRRDLTRGLAGTPAAGSTAASELGDTTAVFTLPTPGPYGRTARLPTNAVWTPSTLSDGGTNNGEPHAPTWSEVRAWCNIRAVGNSGAIDPVSGPLVSTTRNGITCPTTTGHAIMPVVVMLELGYGLDVGADSKYRVMMRPRVVLMNPYNVALNRATYSVIYQSYVTSNSDLTFTMALDATHSSNQAYFLTSGAGLITPNPINGVRQLSFNVTDSFGPGEVRIYSLPASAADIQVNNGVFDLEPGLSTNRAYLATGTSAPGWYDPSQRNLISVTWAKIPADHPRISIALGASNTTTVAVPSITDRYIQTDSSVLYGLSGGKPNPVAKLDTDQARQLRTIRFTLRHAGLDLLTHGNGSMAAEGEIGGNLASDTTSGARFLIDDNPRGIVSQRLGGRDNVANYAITTLKGAGYTEVDYDVSGGTTFAFWGGSTKDDGFGTTHAVLFDVLRQNEEIVSLGRLGQVNWGVDGKHPAYPLGNSFASVFYNYNTPDFGYALNEALWDRFFLSTLPASLATRPANLPDSRLHFHDPAGSSTDITSLEGVNGYPLAATRLVVDGAFNINSTSVEAWTTFLGSVQAADYAYATRSSNRTDSTVRAFPRLQSMHDPDPTSAGQAGNMYEWTGYRQLNATQLGALATQIVAAIKARARPARSLAEFINRDLSQPATDTRNQMGVVQAAIDAVVNTDKPSSGGPGLADLPGLNTAKIVPVTFSLADNPDAARGRIRSAGAPGFLLQSDLLAPLAPSMSARSDTFRVRTYGEMRNPVTGEINGRAWCEAVVQRIPEFVGGEAAELRLGDSALGTASKTFGRKFVVTQFRWLSPDEI